MSARAFFAGWSRALHACNQDGSRDMTRPWRIFHSAAYMAGWEAGLDFETRYYLPSMPIQYIIDARQQALACYYLGPIPPPKYDSDFLEPYKRARFKRVTA